MSNITAATPSPQGQPPRPTLSDHLRAAEARTDREYDRCMAEIRTKRAAARAARRGGYKPLPY